MQSGFDLSNSAYPRQTIFEGSSARGFRILYHHFDGPTSGSTRRYPMNKVQDILANKGNRVITISPAKTVLAAAQLMNEHKIGALVVLDEASRVVGMFTERDVLHRVVAQRLDPASTTISDVMTSAVLCSRGETPLDEA